MTKSAIETAVELDNVGKTYVEHQMHALSGINLTVETGEFVVVMGPSGCGKSTLLNLVAGIDTPSQGKISIAGKSLEHLSDEELTFSRRQNIGFIFQFFNLLSTLSVEENVSLPLELCGNLNPKSIKQQVAQMLERVNMSNRANFYPAELSGGEMQRTAIARALINNPKLLVADEPTGNLDSVNGGAILELLKAFSTENKQTIIMATHSPEAERFADRIIEMKDGTIIGERRQCQPV